MKRLVFIFLVVLGTASLASAQAIDVSFAADGSDCDADVAPNTPVTFYVLARLGGAAAGGITAAEFRLEGTPAGWFQIADPNPAASIFIGNPLGATGCYVAFPSCQTGVGGIVPLLTFQGFATTAVGETYLHVVQRNPPFDPRFPCSCVVLCGDPAEPVRVCAVGGAAIINGRPCTVAVEASSWTTVKSLYD